MPRWRCRADVPVRCADRRGGGAGVGPADLHAADGGRAAHRRVGVLPGRSRTPSVVPVAVPGKEDAGTTRPGARVLGSIDGTRTLEELARVTGLGEFEATTALFALLQRGAAQLRKPPTAKDLGGQVEGRPPCCATYQTVDASGVGEKRATLSMFP